jgi:hypothetical protein
MHRRARRPSMPCRVSYRCFSRQWPHVHTSVCIQLRSYRVPVEDEHPSTFAATFGRNQDAAGRGREVAALDGVPKKRPFLDEVPRASTAS